MKNFNSGTLRIVLNKRGSESSMSWIGQSDERNPSASLTPYLDSVISDLKGTHLTIEYSRLEYMNSSTVPPIIQFLKKLNINGIKTIVTYDASSKWQRASFKALETLSLMMNNVTVKGR